MKKVLFITYDGILEPLGYSQILSYLIHLSKNNKIHILSVEKEDDLKNKKYYLQINKLLKQNNIYWEYLKYSKKFKILILFKLFLKTLKILLLKKINIAHARSYIPAITCYFFRHLFNFKFIFDMRGFWIDERIDWKIWPKKSIKYYLFKFLEKKIILKSNVIVTLTNDASIFIKKNFKLNKTTKIYVIPTSIKINNSLIKKNNKKILSLTHLGAIGTRYDFINVIKFYKYIEKKINTKLLVYNKGEHEIIFKNLNINNVKKNKFNVKYIKPNLISRNINEYSLGIFFPVKGFYLKGYFPTKLGEFLSNGVPIITCSINKHVDRIIKENKVGIILNLNDDYKKINIIKNIKGLLNNKTSNRCINTAKKHLNIEYAVKTYEKIYKT